MARGGSSLGIKNFRVTGRYTRNVRTAPETRRLCEGKFEIKYTPMTQNTFLRICLLLTVVIAPAAYSQNGGVPRVLTQSSPDTPLAGAEWTFTLLIAHPLPHEVTVLAPNFPESLFLDRVLKSARLMPYTDAPGRWTEAEYRFITKTPGTYTIDPFVIITPNARVSTEALTLTVRDVRITDTVRQYRLAWDGVPALLRIGETAVLYLKISGWDSGLPLPGPRVFMPLPEEGFIIEAGAPDSGGPASVLCVNVTPLAARNLNLPARTVTHNNINFEIPPLGINVSPALWQAREAAAEAAEEPQDFAFPEFESPAAAGFFSRLFFRIGAFRADYESVYRAAENLCKSGSYAEALALLRRNERDHAAFPLFASLRRQLESERGLPVTWDEKPLKFGIILYLIFCGIAALVFVILVLRKTGRKSMLMLCVIFVLCGAAALVFCLSGTPAGGGRYYTAVLKETDLRQVPDLSGLPQARLSEGQPARVLRTARNQDGENAALGDTRWVWIITRDSERLGGWIPEDRAVYY